MGPVVHVFIKVLVSYFFMHLLYGKLSLCLVAILAQDSDTYFFSHPPAPDSIDEGRVAPGRGSRIQMDDGGFLGTGPWHRARKTHRQTERTSFISSQTESERHHFSAFEDRPHPLVYVYVLFAYGEHKAQRGRLSWAAGPNFLGSKVQHRALRPWGQVVPRGCHGHQGVV